MNQHYSFLNRFSFGEDVSGGLGSLSLGELGLVLVEFHELGKIELGLLEDLDLADKDVLKGEDLAALLGDLLANLVGDELLEEILEGALGDFDEKDFHHLGAEDLLLGALGVASGLNLVLVAAGEGDGEDADEVAVGGLGLDESLDEGVPLLDEGAELVTSDVHTVEVGVAIETLDFFALELDLSPGLLVGILVELTEGDGEHAATEGVGGDLLSGGLVAGGQGGNAHVENAGHMNVVPFFLDESMLTKRTPPGLEFIQKWDIELETELN